jgi:hypothetical protein
MDKSETGSAVEARREISCFTWRGNQVINPITIE